MDKKVSVSRANQFLLTNKDADIVLENSKDEAWSLWFFDTPEVGECLSVEYIPINRPSVTIQVQDAADATKNIADLLHTDHDWERVGE